MGKNASKIIIKNLSSKYSQKILDHDKQSAIYSLKTSSKRVISKTVEASGNLIGNNIADNVTKISKSL